ncbi:hypothetical protein GA0070216_1063 [Micromonospora matsumotoense]|uniref:Uncharacterized protein n=1 Tax=Micromonospora matsumotoense TaxID=121616 RepID=A0A1C4Y9U0_9ACTN|nr:hypothetical protein GA0070216_1063 [Micromonospora matsumotoense]
MTDDTSPESFIVRPAGATVTTPEPFCHRSFSVSPEAADRPVTAPASPDSERTEVSSRPPRGRSADRPETEPFTVLVRHAGTVYPLVRSADAGGPGVLVVRSGEVGGYDRTR